jgi:hypothetical protein
LTGAVGEVVANVQQEVTGAVHELESAVAGIVDKRQSFISKLFGVGTKKKQEETATEEGEEHVESTDAHEEPESAEPQQEGMYKLLCLLFQK